MEKNVLLVIDIQNDFCPGGSLAVPEGDKIIPVVNKIMGRFYKVVATQDWHPKNHISFASTHKKQIYENININGVSQTLWPDHCVQGTYGAELHKELDIREIDLIIRKGVNPQIDSYSAFLENDKQTKTGLDGYLNSLGIKKVYVCGLALDYCVYFTACDSVKFGFETYVIIDATKGVDVPQGNVKKVIEHMKSLNIKIVLHEEL